VYSLTFNASANATAFVTAIASVEIYQNQYQGSGCTLTTKLWADSVELDAKQMQGYNPYNPYTTALFYVQHTLLFHGILPTVFNQDAQVQFKLTGTLQGPGCQATYSYWRLVISEYSSQVML